MEGEASARPLPFELEGRTTGSRWMGYPSRTLDIFCSIIVRISLRAYTRTWSLRPAIARRILRRSVPSVLEVQGEGRRS